MVLFKESRREKLVREREREEKCVEGSENDLHSLQALHFATRLYIFQDQEMCSCLATKGLLIGLASNKGRNKESKNQVDIEASNPSTNKTHNIYIYKHRFGYHFLAFV